MSVAYIYAQILYIESAPGHKNVQTFNSKLDRISWYS